MSVWNFTSTATSLGFTTGGVTTDVGIYTIKGPASFVAPGSYYANGSHRFNLGATRGLINRVQLGTDNYTAAAGTVITNNATSIGLGTSGVTGVFTMTFVHPEKFAVGAQWSPVYAPKYTEVTIKVHHGIIYGWSDCIKFQFNPPYYPLYTSPVMTAETGQGVGVLSNATNLRIIAGLSGTLTYYAAYDVTCYSDHYVRVYYNKFIITLSSGLLTSFTTTSGLSLFYYAVGTPYPGNPPGTGNVLSWV